MNHKKSILCKAIDKNSVCCLPTYPRKLAFWLLLSEFWAGSFRFFYLDYRWSSQATVHAW